MTDREGRTEADDRPRTSDGGGGDGGGEGEALVLLYPGCTLAETIELATRLADHDLTPVHVGLDREPFRDRSGLLVRADRAVDEIDPGAVRVVVVPGGDPETILGDPAATGAVGRLVGGVAEAGGLVAGICAGVLVLAAAGVLTDRTITHNYRAPWAPPEVERFVERFWEGATVEPDTGRGVVVDGTVVTALPTATIEFTTTVCLLLGLVDEGGAARLADRLRGDHGA